MAKKKRDYAKRNMGYALQSCDKVMERLLELKEMFEGHPSKYGEWLEQIAGMQLMVQKTIEKLATQLWGYVPAKLERWTGTGREHTNRVREAREAWQSGESGSNNSLPQVQTELHIPHAESRATE